MYLEGKWSARLIKSSQLAKNSRRDQRCRDALMDHGADKEEPQLLFPDYVLPVPTDPFYWL